MSYKQLFINNYESDLGAAFSSTDTTIKIVGHIPYSGIKGTSDYYIMTIVEGATMEVLRVFADELSYTSGVATHSTPLASRGLEGTSAHSFTTAAKVSIRPTSSSIEKASLASPDSKLLPIKIKQWTASESLERGHTRLSTSADYLLTMLDFGATSGATEPNWSAASFVSDSAIVLDNGFNWYVTSFTWDANTLSGTDIIALSDNYSAHNIELQTDNKYYGISANAIHSSSSVGTEHNYIPYTRVERGIPYAKYYTGGSDITGATLGGVTYESVIVSDPLDMKSAGTAVFSYTLPKNLRFFPTEVGYIVTKYSGSITTKPTISFGYESTPAGFLAATLTTAAAAYARNRYATLVTYDGKTFFSASITSAAVGSGTIEGKFYFKGLFVEVA